MFTMIMTREFLALCFWSCHSPSSGRDEEEGVQGMAPVGVARPRPDSVGVTSRDDLGAVAEEAEPDLVKPPKTVA